VHVLRRRAAFDVVQVSWSETEMHFVAGTLVVALLLIAFSKPVLAWTPSEYDNEQSAKPFAVGQFRYVPELNGTNPHNVVGFNILKGNKTVLQQRFKVLSIEEC